MNRQTESDHGCKLHESQDCQAAEYWKIITKFVMNFKHPHGKRRRWILYVMIESQLETQNRLWLDLLSNFLFTVKGLYCRRGCGRNSSTPREQMLWQHGQGHWLTQLILPTYRNPTRRLLILASCNFVPTFMQQSFVHLLSSTLLYPMLHTKASLLNILFSTLFMP